MLGSGCNPKVTEKNADLQPAAAKKACAFRRKAGFRELCYLIAPCPDADYAIQLVSSFIAPSGVHVSVWADAGISTVSP